MTQTTQETFRATQTSTQGHGPAAAPDAGSPDGAFFVVEARAKFPTLEDAQSFERLLMDCADPQSRKVVQFKSSGPYNLADQARN